MIIYKNLSLTDQIAELKSNGAEIIIVNDSSTDNSVQKIRTAVFLKSYQVSIIQMSFHQGVELSMNAGLDLSTGDFVYEFDSVIIDFDKVLIEQSYRKILEG
ncbi:MAG: glycosyltransferase, partial [Pedobacter sp.]